MASSEPLSPECTEIKSSSDAPPGGGFPAGDHDPRPLECDVTAPHRPGPPVPAASDAGCDVALEGSRVMIACGEDG